MFSLIEGLFSQTKIIKPAGCYHDWSRLDDDGSSWRKWGLHPLWIRGAAEDVGLVSSVFKSSFFLRWWSQLTFIRCPNGSIRFSHIHPMFATSFCLANIAMARLLLLILTAASAQVACPLGTQAGRCWWWHVLRWVVAKSYTSKRMVEPYE